MLINIQRNERTGFRSLDLIDYARQYMCDEKWEAEPRGVVEQTEYDLGRLNDKFARLIHILASREVLKPSEIVYIVTCEAVHDVTLEK